MTAFPKYCLLLLIAAVLGACGGKREADPSMAPAVRAPRPEPLKAAWIYVGPVADAGWNAAHERARRAVEAHFGANLQTTFVENVREGADAERVTRDLAARGSDLIFATSASLMASTSGLAGEFPHVRFEQVDGNPTSDNLRTYRARFYEGAYLAGVIAGSMTKGHTLGFVGAFPGPQALQNLNAFTLGARRVNAKVSTRVAWTYAWFDPVKEAYAAQHLIDAGADVLLQNTYSTAVLQTAEKNGKYAFGWNSDMSAFAPGAHLASCVVDWAPYYTQAIQAILDGQPTSQRTVRGAREARVQLLRIAESVPAETRKLVEKLGAGLSDGSFHPYTGPLVDSAGRERLGADAMATQVWLDKVDFYVTGVVGTVPVAR